MMTVQLAISVTQSLNCTTNSFQILSSNKLHRLCHFSSGVSSLSHPSNSGLACRASQAVDIFPTLSPEIDVREARLEDSWEVAETHCSSFFPEYSFPYDFLLRINRLIGMLIGGNVPQGCRRACLVAVTGCSSVVETFLYKEYVAGILTVDTVADFLPRKGPLLQRRTGVAYLSNVAVRERFRRRGVAKKLIAKAEAQARSWSCRAIALHCDYNNTRAIDLYKSLGFKCIKVPDGANWPQPKISPGVNFAFMMKLLSS